MSVPVARTVAGANPLTVAWVPTGMKAGVATKPWGVGISPQRAAPSVAIRRKENAGDIDRPTGETTDTHLHRNRTDSRPQWHAHRPVSLHRGRRRRTPA